MTKNELLEMDGAIISLEVLEAIQEMEEVLEVENCGFSGQYYNHKWYVVKTYKNEEVNVYAK